MHPLGKEKSLEKKSIRESCGAVVIKEGLSVSLVQEVQGVPSKIGGPF